MKNKGFKAVIFLQISLFITGCYRPVAEFENYNKSFQESRQIIENEIIRGRLVAKEWADSPYNPDSTAVKNEKLNQRLASLDARFETLNILDSYNGLLLGLAGGQDPAVLKDNLNSIRVSLENYGKSLARVASQIAVYGPAIEVAVRAVDRAIKRNRMKEAIIGAREVLPGMFEVFKDDISNIQDAWESQSAAKYSEQFSAIQKCASAFISIAGKYKTGDTLNGYIDKMNEIRRGVVINLMGSSDETARLPALVINPDADASETLAPDMPHAVKLELLIDQAAGIAEKMKGIENEIEARRKIVLADNRHIEVTISVFESLINSVEDDSYDFVYAGNLLEASLRAYKEVKIAYEENR